MKMLIAGSKEYPWGTNTSDPIPSGGIEKYIENLAIEFKKYPEHELIIITRLFPGTKKFEKKDNITTYRVPYLNGRLIRNISFNIMGLIKSLKIDFDIILTNGEISAFLELYVAKKKNKPIIYISHGDSSTQPQYNFILKYVFKRLSQIIYNHSDVTVAPIDTHVKKYTENYRVIRPGIEIDNLIKSSEMENGMLRRKLNILKDDIVVIFIGRMVDVKGINLLIDAAYDLHDKNIVFLFVGDGPELKKYKKRINLSDCRCIFVGHQSNVAKYLSISDMYILPSMSEGFSYTAMEAAYMKVPIIITNIGVIPNNCGQIMRERKTTEIVDQINFLVNNPHIAKKNVENAYEYSLKFNMKDYVKDIIKTCEDYMFLYK